MLAKQTLIQQSYSIKESLLRSKTGADIGGEDRIVHTQFAIGVVDGATDSKGVNWSLNPAQFESSGSFLADCIQSAFSKSGEIALIIRDINKNVAERAKYLLIDLNSPESRPNASFSIFLPEKNQIIQIGDCQLGIVLDDGKFLVESFIKKVDLLTAMLRATEIKSLIADNIDPFANGKDLGREKILPLIRKQYELVKRSVEDQSRLGKMFWAEGARYEDLFYDVIDGVSNPKVREINLPQNVSEIILCSDGYPEVRQTLEDSEERLQQVIVADPHAYQLYPSTKGIVKGNVSFDDRSYVRLKRD